MQLAILLGTRPEIIKLSPVIRACQSLELPFFVLHSGQHYSYEMDRVFFEQLELPEPRYNLQAGSGAHGAQTGRMLTGIEKVLLDERPDVLLAQGDTNTVLAGALAASKLGVRFAHVEAGLRSFDRSMPEETNRVLVDQISDYLFAPTQSAAENLRREGLAEERLFVTGNTIVDAVQQNAALAEQRSRVLERLGLERRGYILVTVHRAENVDDPQRFAGILNGVREIGQELGLPVLYPIHPRARKRLAEFQLDALPIQLCDPVDFLDFLALEKNARLVLTDSGGVQEETCVFRVPCVTLRENTERPETIAAGANVLAGADPSRIVQGCREQLQKATDWKQPFGDGAAGDRIVRIVRDQGV